MCTLYSVAGHANSTRAQRERVKKNTAVEMGVSSGDSRRFTDRWHRALVKAHAAAGLNGFPDGDACRTLVGPQSRTVVDSTVVIGLPWMMAMMMMLRIAGENKATGGTSWSRSPVGTYACHEANRRVMGSYLRQYYQAGLDGTH